MVKCHLSTLMGRHKMKIADVSRETELNRSTITAMYNEDVKRIDVEAVDKLCQLFNCQVSDIFEYIEE